MSLIVKIFITLTIWNLYSSEASPQSIQPERARPTLPPCMPITTTTPMPMPRDENTKIPQVRDRNVIAEPLTRRQCDTIYRDLRVCRFNLTEITAPFLCPTRDTFTGRERPNRQKRSIMNPCAGSEQVYGVLRATDMNGVLRDVVIDPANYLYPTIFIKDCGDQGASGYQCAPHSITLRLAVFGINDDEITVEDVTVPAYCALSIGTD